MGWKQYERSVQAAARRAQRDVERRHREYQREQVRYQKEAARDAAASSVERYEDYIQQLVGVHTECGPRWDWRTIATTPPPPEPFRRNDHQRAAEAQLNTYAPGFFEKLFGGAKKRRDVLEGDVVRGRLADDRDFDAAIQEHRRLHQIWATRIELAPRVLILEPVSCRNALAHAGSFDDLAAFHTRVTLEGIRSEVAMLKCTIEDDDIVPHEELKLTASGKVSTKDLPASRYWSLFQDHVCSTGLRVARETFAVIPVARAIVNVFIRRLNPVTGHMDLDCILAAHFTHQALATIRLDAIDPSESMKNFNHRMKFKKTTGFECVEPTSFDEHWVTT